MIAKFFVISGVLYFFGARLLKLDWAQFDSVRFVFPVFFFLSFIMVVLNWGVELIKWRTTARVVQIDSRRIVIIESLLAGISTGIITPNRIGNFIGRMMFYSSSSRAMVILGSLYGNLAQFLASILIGLPGLFFLGLHYFSQDIQPILFWGLTAFSVACALCYLLFPWLPVASYFAFTNKTNLLEKFRVFAQKLVVRLFLLSVFRYLVFATQYLLLLVAFGAEFSYHLLLGISLTYLITTLIPGFVLGKLLVRETVALSVLSHFIPNPAIILIASFALWLINLGLPALVGLFYVIKAKGGGTHVVV